MQSASAGALEAAIRARIAIDARAREIALQIEGKLVQIDYDNEVLYVEFLNGSAHVRKNVERTPDLRMEGNVLELGKFLISDQTADVEIDGDEELLDQFRKIFKPSLSAENVAKRARSTAEYGVAAARSALEGLASEFSGQNSKERQDQLDELSEQIRNLQTQVEVLERRLKDLEER